MNRPGTTNFPYVSLFSGGNHLQNISMSTRYAGIMGYTYEEITNVFAAHIQAVAQAQSRTESAVLAEIEAWYGDYRFSSTATKVCNPCSALKYFDTKEPRIYWQATTLSSQIHHEIKQHPASIVPLTGAKTTNDELMNPDMLVQRDLKSLMFYVGYLTIKDGNARLGYYDLGFPNQEVREAFTTSLIRHFAKLDVLLSATMETALEEHKLTFFFEHIEQLIAGFPHQLFIKSEAHIYHGFVLSLLSGMGLEVAAETPSNLGRLDLLVQVRGTTYIMRLKLDKSPEEEIKQIREKQYYLPYLQQGHKLALVGLNFSSDSRNIAGWAAELLDEQGKLIQTLTPEAKH